MPRISWSGSSGGAGPGGVKAVAPTGNESIVLTLPEDVTEAVLLGEKLVVERLGATEVVSASVSAGRPIAIVSQVEIEYRPGKPLGEAVRRPIFKGRAGTAES